MNDMKADNLPWTGDGAGVSQTAHALEAYSAPLDAASHGRLVFVSGVQGLNLGAGAAPEMLVQGYFRGEAPRIWRRDSIVTVRYKRTSLLEQLVNWHTARSELLLNEKVPWELEFNSGVSQLRADFSNVQLRSLDILGGASKMRLRLSRPEGTAFIYISGGISLGEIKVPPATGVRVQVGGGASRLTFAEQRFGAVGGETSLQSPNFETASSRFDICIAGGASYLDITFSPEEV